MTRTINETKKPYQTVFQSVIFYQSTKDKWERLDQIGLTFLFRYDKNLLKHQSERSAIKHDELENSLIISTDIYSKHKGNPEPCLNYLPRSFVMILFWQSQ